MKQWKVSVSKLSFFLSCSQLMRGLEIATKQELRPNELQYLLLILELVSVETFLSLVYIG